MAVKGRNYQLKTEWNDILDCFDKESKKKKLASLQFPGYHRVLDNTQQYTKVTFLFLQDQII